MFLFFIVYKLDPRVVDIAGQQLSVGGIYSATAVLIISSLVVYGALFISQRKLEKSQWLTLVACLVFGSLGMTVLFLVGQGVYLSRHLHDTEPTTPKTED
nr:septation protein IspZ [Pseudomonas morbosilactucae]